MLTAVPVLAFVLTVAPPREEVHPAADLTEKSMVRPEAESPTAWTVAGAKNLIRFRLLRTPQTSVVIAEKRFRTAEAGGGTKIAWRVLELQRGRSTKPTVELEEDLSFWDFDVASSGDATILMLEINHGPGAVVASLRPSGALEGLLPFSSKKQTSIADLPKHRENEIVVGVSWHQIFPAPRWLFSSRVRKSSGGSWLITCNTLDGRILQLQGPRAGAGPQGFRLSGEPSTDWTEVRFGERGLYPVAIETDPSRPSSLAYVVAELPASNLFGSLANRRPEQRPRGALHFARAGEPALNLSAQAKLGAVVAFDLDGAGGNELLLAAVHETGGKWTLTALSSSDGGRAWKTAAVLPLPGPASQVAALASRSDPSYVAFALPEKDDFTTIRAIALGRE